MQVLAGRPGRTEGNWFLRKNSDGRIEIAANQAGILIEGMVSRGLIHIGARTDAEGNEENYFDLQPLWQRLQALTAAPSTPASETAEIPVVTLFESEFGRPLSGFECEQIRNWMGRDGHPRG